MPVWSCTRDIKLKYCSTSRTSVVLHEYRNNLMRPSSQQLLASAKWIYLHCSLRADRPWPKLNMKRPKFGTTSTMYVQMFLMQIKTTKTSLETERSTSSMAWSRKMSPMTPASPYLWQWAKKEDHNEKTYLLLVDGNCVLYLRCELWRFGRVAQPCRRRNKLDRWPGSVRHFLHFTEKLRQYKCRLWCAFFRRYENYV